MQPVARLVVPVGRLGRDPDRIALRVYHGRRLTENRRFRQLSLKCDVALL